MVFKKAQILLILQNSNVADIEKKIDCGQIEELIVQARNEISLVKNMQKWKPWESLIEQPPKHQWTWPPYKWTFTSVFQKQMLIRL